MHTTWTILLVMDIMKPDRPSEVMLPMVFIRGFMEERRMRRMVPLPVRKRKVQAAEAAWEMTVAMAAPCTPMSSAKMKMGSRMIFKTAPISVVTMPMRAKPWALM